MTAELLGTADLFLIGKRMFGNVRNGRDLFIADRGSVSTKK